MPGHRIRARPARSEQRTAREHGESVPLRDDPDVLSAFSRGRRTFSWWPGGARLRRRLTKAKSPKSFGAARRVLPIGAQSSLTGGATPMGDVILSTSKLNRILTIGNESVRTHVGGVAVGSRPCSCRVRGNTTRPSQRSWAPLSAASSRQMPRAPRRFVTGRPATGCRH